jgi:hypothetical protein
MLYTFVFVGIRISRMGRKRTEKFNYYVSDNRVAGYSFCYHTEAKR